MNICIICPLSNSLPTYSIASVIKAQCSLLSKFHHDVTVVVNENFSGTGFSGARLLKILPLTDLVDYSSKLSISKEHEAFATNVAAILSPRLEQFDVVITHDLILTGWYMPFALSLMSMGEENPEVPFFHFIHSDPTIQPPRDWWNFNHYMGNHTIVYPTAKPLIDISKVFNTNRVICIPHIIDPKHIYGFSEQTNDIVKLLPSIYSADIVQISCMATDRLDAKGARELINLFGLLRRSGRSVCLIIANQFSGRREGRMVDPILYYEKVARRCGLDPYTDFIFTSELFNGKYTDGLPQRVLFELMSLANLSVMTSKSESFGLGLIEAMMSSAVICVANEHLNLPIKQYTSFDFKAFNETDQQVDLKSLSGLVDWIIEQMESNSVIKARTIIRQTLNPSAVYTAYYKPLFAALPASSFSPIPPSYPEL